MISYQGRRRGSVGRSRGGGGGHGGNSSVQIGSRLWSLKNTNINIAKSHFWISELSPNECIRVISLFFYEIFWDTKEKRP